jgi:hypothetical protein
LFKIRQVEVKFFHADRQTDGWTDGHNEAISTHFMFSNFFSEHRAVYEMKPKNVVEPEMPQVAIWRRVACWIGKATRAQAHARACAPTHARTLTHKIRNNFAFPQQQWLRERA